MKICPGGEFSFRRFDDNLRPLIVGAGELARRDVFKNVAAVQRLDEPGRADEEKLSLHLVAGRGDDRWKAMRRHSAPEIAKRGGEPTVVAAGQAMMIALGAA